MLRKYLEDNKCFTQTIDSKLTQLVKGLDTNLTNKQKLQLVCHYLCTYASQFRIPIFFDNQNIPINSISFLFSYSGSGKDTTINKIRQIFNNSYDLIYKYLEHKNNEQALEQCNGDPSKIDKYLYKLPPLEVGISTPEGLLDSINTLQNFDIGSINVNTNEFISEISSSSINILGLLSTIAEIYDVGSKTSRQLKDKTNQVGNLNNIFLNALFTSSFNLMTDSTVRSKLLVEFKSRFARRSSVTFNAEELIDQEISNIEEWLYNQKKRIYYSAEMTNQYSEYFLDLTKHYITHRLSHLELEDDALDLYLVYREYCFREGKNNDTLQKQFSNINLMHRAFQALKLSGALCLLNKETKIKKEHILHSINILEIISSDIEIFETELNKENYEILVNYCSKKCKDTLELNYHELRKAGLVNSSNIKQSISNLISMANSYDKEGLYSTEDDRSLIKYTKFNKTDEYEVSYFESQYNDKESKSKELYKEFKTSKVSFDRLGNLLKSGCSYSNFTFKNGKRNNDNINEYTNWLVFDVDNSIMDIYETHDLLKDYVNHHICTTSNKDNLFKFRVILELDSYAHFDKRIFKQIMKQVSAEFLPCINIDNLPMSQVYYSYKDSIVLSTTDQSKVDIKRFIQNSLIKEVKKPISKAEKSHMLDDMMNTFSYAIDSFPGNRNLNLIRAINHAYDLGAGEEQIEALIREINQLIDFSLTEQELERNILPHLRKKFT